MNFLRNLIIGIRNLFAKPLVPRPIIDESKIYENIFPELPEFTDTRDTRDTRDPTDPREFILEPYTSVFTEGVVETPLFPRDHMPTAPELLEPLPSVDMATEINTQH
jgi:hypothetical protein